MQIKQQCLPLLVVALALTLGGCAAPASVQMQESQAAFDSATKYCESLFTDAALSPLAEKTRLTGNQPPSFQMLADLTTVTDEQKPLVAIWGEKSIQCQEKWISSMKQHVHALLVANRQSSYVAGNSLRTDLYNARIPWGQYNQTRQKMIADTQKAHAEIADALNRKDQQLAIERQRSAALEYSNYLQAQRNVILQQPAIAPATNINCTTQTIGGVTTTNCR